MSQQIISYLVCNVFALANSHFSGNSLAVCYIQEPLTSEDMQQVAASFHLAETSFVTLPQEPQGPFETRIFTSEQEVPFAGHPSLGTVHALRRWYGKRGVALPDQIRLSLQKSLVEVEFDGKNQIYWLSQPAPVFCGEVNASQLFQVFSINSKSSQLSGHYPIVSTGLPYALVPLEDEDDLASIQSVATDVMAFCQQHAIFGVLFYAPKSHKTSESYDYGVRVFIAELAMPEDPATGSANGCLAAWLLQSSQRESIEFNVLQGQSMGHPSHLILQAERVGMDIKVRCGGRVHDMREGLLFLPRD